MGTRHLIEVKLDGKLRIAQYGQWDGYPAGQGRGIANFLHKEMDREKFKAALRECRFMTKEEMDAFNEEHGEKSWQKTHQWLSRDAGSDVLKHVQDGGARVLVDESDFKNDHTFCEYHYLIDMDSETVSVNGGDALPFAGWTDERMDKLESQDREDDDE